MAAFRFTTMSATESIDARTEVVDHAAELHESDLKSWQRSCDAADAAGKPRPRLSMLASSFEYCLTSSRRTRIRRERTESYFNQKTARNPLY